MWRNIERGKWPQKLSADAFKMIQGNHMNTYTINKAMRRYNWRECVFAVRAIWYTFALTFYEQWIDDYSDLASENYKKLEAKIMKSVSAEYFLTSGKG